jgi:hypothetical protein
MTDECRCAALCETFPLGSLKENTLSCHAFSRSPTPFFFILFFTSSILLLLRPWLFVLHPNSDHHGHLFATGEKSEGGKIYWLEGIGSSHNSQLTLGWDFCSKLKLKNKRPKSNTSPRFITFVPVNRKGRGGFGSTMFCLFHIGRWVWAEIVCRVKCSMGFSFQFPNSMNSL